MKPKLQRTEHRLRLATAPVKYQWATPDGTVHHGNTVVVAPTRARLARALKDFWRLNPHVEEL